MYGIYHFERAQATLAMIDAIGEMPADKLAALGTLAQAHATLALAAPAYALHRPPTTGPAPTRQTVEENPLNYPRAAEPACLLFDCGMGFPHTASAHDA